MKRTPMKRTKPLRQRRREGSDIVREERPRALVPATRAPVRGTYAGSTSGQAVEKAPPTKPGKRAPTKAERQWMDAIVRYGCIACRLDGQPPRPTAVHHMLRGGRRIGHLSTLPLCDPGHHQGGEPMGMVSRHPWKARFEERYGAEECLLEMLQAELLKLQPDGSYAP